MHYSKHVFYLLVLNRAWSTKTNSLAYEYAKDKDSQPKSHREMETSPLADIGILSSFTKKNSIRSKLKGAEPSFKSEQGIIEVVLDGGEKVNQHICGLKRENFVPKCIPDGKKCDVRGDGTSDCCVGMF